MLAFFPNYNTALDQDPGEWALAREAEGYQGVVISDHLWVNDKPYPHVWVTLTRVACATTTLKFASSFCNNLFRSPVEFAQAALTLHQLAPGRFEAGLGAGWSESEIIGSGGQYPDGPTRADRYREAMMVVRQLFEQGACQFDGDHYSIDVPVIGPFDGTAPLLVGSAGGPRTRREITPLVDRLEIFAGGFIRDGMLDMAKLAQVSWDDVRIMVDKVREIDADIPLGYFTQCAAGTGPEIDGLKQILGDGLAGGFVGSPQEVADNLARMEGLGFSRMQLTEMVPGTYSNLSNELF